MSTKAEAVANVRALNLDFLVSDLIRQGHSEETAFTSVEHYRQFWETHVEFPRIPLVPTKLVDLAWHAHLMRPKRYFEDCMVCFRHIFDHTPGVLGTPEYISAYRSTRNVVPYGHLMPENFADGGMMGGADCYERNPDEEWPPLNNVKALAMA